MIDHIHFRRSGETKLVIEMTFTSEQELSLHWEKFLAWYKVGPRSLQLSIGKSNTISLERVKT